MFVAELSGPKCLWKSSQRGCSDVQGIDGLVNNAGVNDGIGLAMGAMILQIASAI
jgi:hypothetical protein